jgi:hypothetical protein
MYKLGGYTYDAAGRDVNDDGYYWERIMSLDAYENRWTPLTTRMPCIPRGLQLTLKM